MPFSMGRASPHLGPDSPCAGALSLGSRKPSWVPMSRGRCWWWHLASGGAVGLFYLHFHFSRSPRLLYAHYLLKNFGVCNALPGTAQTTQKGNISLRRENQLPCIVWIGFKILLHVKWEWLLKWRTFNWRKDSHFSKSLSIKKHDPAR